jgi:hypothetical protein
VLCMGPIPLPTPSQCARLHRTPTASCPPSTHARACRSMAALHPTPCLPTTHLTAHPPARLPACLPPPALSLPDPPAVDDNLLGQTADFPGIGSQAESSFIDSAAAQRAQHEAEEAAAHDAAEAAREAAGGRHLVVAVDDSDASERAMLWAVDNLYRPGDSVHIMHIIPAMPYRWAGGRGQRDLGREGGRGGTAAGVCVRKKRGWKGRVGQAGRGVGGRACSLSKAGLMWGWHGLAQAGDRSVGQQGCPGPGGAHGLLVNWLASLLNGALCSMPWVEGHFYAVLKGGAGLMTSLCPTNPGLEARPVMRNSSVQIPSPNWPCPGPRTNASQAKCS